MMGTLWTAWPASEGLFDYTCAGAQHEGLAAALVMGQAHSVFLRCQTPQHLQFPSPPESTLEQKCHLDPGNNRQEARQIRSDPRSLWLACRSRILKW